MAQQKTILVTGVAGYWGARVAQRLLTESGLHVMGVDATPPQELPEGLDFVQADIRNPLMVELLKAERVDTICHLAFSDSRRRNEANFDLNVMGAMKIFGAAAQAGVRKIVYRSSTAVYGALPQNPAYLSETQPLHGSKQYGYTRYMVEIEEFCDGFRSQQPNLIVTSLRFANIVGETAVTPLTILLRGKAAPVLLGFDPMMQVIHEDDVVEALVHAVQHDKPGIFNVAAPGLMPLTRILALTGVLPVPVLHPLAYWGVQNVRGRFSLARLIPFDPDYLRYRWVADTHKMEQEFGFVPQISMEEALRAFATARRARSTPPDDDEALELDAERLRHTLERRQRQRARREQQKEAAQ